MHAGYEVSLASGGIEALQLLRQALADNHPYDVVLADYQMHDMDGAALGERINARSAAVARRIVILTSMDRARRHSRFASLGFAGYLTKPVRARELFECLDRVLARDAKEWHLQSQPIVTRGTLVGDEAPRRYDGHVLLVEDNPVNQKVAVRFLERMGCHGARRRQRRRRRQGLSGGALRHRAHGSADAGHGRPDGDAAHSRTRERPSARHRSSRSRRMRCRDNSNAAWRQA